MLDLSHELEVAARLAREAGSAVMRIYATDFSVAYKGVADPVTEADKRANDLIVQKLQQQFTGDIIVAEESPPPESALEKGRVWYVDPLDGTKEFIAKNGEFSVMIGLAIDGDSQLGVVYRPDHDILYSGIADQEAWVYSNGRQRSLRTSMNADPQSLCLAVSRSHRHPFMGAILKKIGLNREIPSGSVGLKIGLIASNQADLYIEPGPYTSLWDACAPEAILRGAGGRFTDILGNPIKYGGGTLKNTKGLVATNGTCHDLVIESIAPLIKEILG